MAVEPVDFDCVSGVGDDGTIPLIRSTVTAFVGRTAAGPVNEPIRITGLAAFRRVFGAHCSFSFVSHAVQHYFEHGGREAIVVRVTNRATRARIDIPAGAQTLVLQAVEPGSQACLRASVDYERVETQRDKFNLVVQRLAGPEAELVCDQEIFRAVSTDPADPRFVAGLLEESKLVRLGGPAPGVRPRVTHAKHPGDPLPYIPMSRAGSDGDALTDYDIVGSNEEGTGLFALERAERIDLLCIPPAPETEIGVTSFVAAERYSRRRNALLVWDPPESWRSVADAVAGMRASAWTSRNALTYFPRIRRRGEAFRFPAGLPACGAVAGGIARADSCGAWARDTAASALLKTSLTPVAHVDARDARALRRCGVNALAGTGGLGTSIQPSVTAAGAGTAAIWRDFHRRRLFLLILSSVEQAGAAALRRGRSGAGARLARRIDEFLHALYARGAFAGTVPAQAFFVQPGVTAEQRRYPVIRFGVALWRAGEFASFELSFGEAGHGLRSQPALETRQRVR